MNWKFWKKNNPVNEEPDVRTSAIHFSTLYRWYCYDIGVDDMPKLDESLGLVPVSEDGADMEREHSERRLEQIGNLIPFITTMSTINSTVFIETQLKKLLKSASAEAELDEELIDKMSDVMFPIYQFVSTAALVSAFAAAVELGIVEPAIVSMEEHSRDEAEGLGYL